jgi:hypothetical protein
MWLSWGLKLATKFEIREDKIFEANQIQGNEMSTVSSTQGREVGVIKLNLKTEKEEAILETQKQNNIKDDHKRTRYYYVN